MRSEVADAPLLFGKLATTKEPFTMALCRTPALKADGTLSLQEHGILGMVTRHEEDEPGFVTTELMGIGRVVLGEPYLLVEETLPRINVTRRTPAQEVKPDAVQDALEAIVEEFCQPLRAHRPTLVHMLEHIVNAHDDVGINIDRVANLISDNDPELQQRFIDELSWVTRLHTLHEVLQNHLTTLSSR